MDARELLAWALEDSLYQVEKSYEGLADFDYKLNSIAKTPREILTHFCETCEAFVTEANGGTHTWGTYSLPPMEPNELMAKYRKLRAEASEVALMATDPKMIKKASEYLVSHESYHVGQLCLIRLAIDPNWNAYSLYR